MSLRAEIRRFEKLRAEAAAESAHERLPRTPAELFEVIGYSPRDWQAAEAERERRFNVRVVHRRAGKSVFEIVKTIDRAVFCPFKDGRYAFMGPTYQQIEDIVWLYLQEFHDALMEHMRLPASRWMDKSKLAAWVPTLVGSRARIRLYGLDSPKQRVRGIYLDGAVHDEYSWIPPSAWNQQVRPMLTDENRAGVDALGRRNQWADFIFTPFGRNHAYTLYRNADIWQRGGIVSVHDPVTGETTESSRDDFSAMLLPASESGVLDREELMSAKVDMGRSKYEQEYECSFDAAVEGAIYVRELEEAREQGRLGTVPWNKLLPVSTAWDLGWDDATAVWFFQQVGDEVRVIDYEEHSGASLDFYADLLAEKGYRYGYHLFPHDVEVHELGTGKTRASVLRQLGVRVSTVAKHSPYDRIAAAQALIPRCTFDAERCAEGLDRLALYRREYDERTQKFREKPVHDWASHGADAFGYLAVGLRRPRARGYGAGNVSHGVF